MGCAQSEESNSSAKDEKVISNTKIKTVDKPDGAEEAKGQTAASQEKEKKEEKKEEKETKEKEDDKKKSEPPPPDAASTKDADAPKEPAAKEEEIEEDIEDEAVGGQGGCLETPPTVQGPTPVAPLPRLSKPHEAMDAKPTFDRFDKKNTGSIPSGDCGTAIRSMGLVCGDIEAEKLLKTLGHEDLGAPVSLELFSKMVATCEKADRSEETNEFKKEFDNFDADGDGKITREEVVKALQKMGQSAEDAESDAKEMFDDADSDGDGHINFAEFCHIMQKE